MKASAGIGRRVHRGDRMRGRNARQGERDSSFDSIGGSEGAPRMAGHAFVKRIRNSMENPVRNIGIKNFEPQAFSSFHYSAVKVQS